jgi:hypothetical protein
LALSFIRFNQIKALAYNLEKFENLKQNVANQLIINGFYEAVKVYINSFDIKAK